MSQMLSPGVFYQRDPLLVLLRGYQHVRTTWIVLLAALVYVAVLLLAPSLVLSSRPQFVGMIGNLSIQCLLHPFGLAIYLRLPDELAGLFNSLERNGVFDDGDNSDASFASLTRDLVGRVDRYRWALVALTAVLLFWIYRLYSGIEWHNLSYVEYRWRVWLIILRALTYVPIQYAILLSLIRFLISLRFTGELFRLLHVRLNPLHPDGCGGLGAIGRLLTASVLVAIAIAIGAVGMALVASANGINPFTRPETWLLGIGYLVAVPFLFAGWLTEPHRAMLAARDMALSPLAREFVTAMQGALSSSCEDGTAIEASTHRLAEITRQYGFLRATIPVFPIGTHAVRRLLATSLAPIVTSFVFPLIEIIASLGSHQ